MEKKIYSIKKLAPIIEEIVNGGNTVEMVVTGNSMYPALRHRKDSVILKKENEYKKYDIILYTRENGDYILHRILKVKNTWVCCAGDNEVKVENNIDKSRIIAKVILIKRGEKIINTGSLGFMLLSGCWALVRPLRHIIIFVYRQIRRVI